MVKCIYCYKKAYYNTNDEENAKYCKDHKLENMVNINKKRCIHKNCNRKAYYNNIGFPVKYCSDHKLENMVNVIFKKCKIEDCKEIAHYNNYGESPIYCSEHKLEKMINVSSKKCKYKNCIKTPLYNYIMIKSPKYCKDHKLENMVYIIQKTCKNENCKISPSYNYIDLPPIYCTNHKLENMVNVISIKCKTITCNKIVTKKYEGYCPQCYIQKNPNKLIKTRSKEYNVINYIVSTFNQYKWKINEKIINGTIKRTPDLLLELDNYIIIIEINEYQHKRYISSYDNDRISELSKHFNKPQIYINFNPDSYKNKKNKKIKSSWINNNGYWIIKNAKEWKNRLQILQNELEKWLKPETILEQNINIINLFYDNYESDLLYNNKSIDKVINIDSETDVNIYYFSELSSDDEDNKKIKVYEQYLDVEFYYFSELSSDEDNDTNINKIKPSVL